MSLARTNQYASHPLTDQYITDIQRGTLTATQSGLEQYLDERIIPCSSTAAE